MPLPRPFDLRSRETLLHLGQLEAVSRGEQPAKTATPGKKAVVLVHGILSNHANTFSDMIRGFQEDSRFDNWELCWFDYDFHDAMPRNGKDLNETLRKNYAAGDEVVIIGHSMGGLVGRFAILWDKMPFVTKLVMLGTPNLGAFRTHHLTLLSQLVLKGTHQVYGLFSRKQGILDLTRVPSLFAEHRDFFPNADHVEYVTIPGLYFGTDQVAWHSNFERWKLLFTGLQMTTVLLSELSHLGVSLERPHDGIVEESSNCMIPGSSSVPATEKTAPIMHPDHFGRRTYCHVVHAGSCPELTHVMIQHDPRIGKVVRDIVSAADIQTWFQDLGKSHDIVARFG